MNCIIGASVSEPHTSEYVGKKLFVSYVRTYVPYVLVLVLITSKPLPALILRVLAFYLSMPILVLPLAHPHWRSLVTWTDLSDGHIDEHAIKDGENATSV